MLMYKLFFLFFSVFVFFYISLSVSLPLISFSVSYFNMEFNFLPNSVFTFSVSPLSSCFMFMVLLVTCMVLFYSEIYMEHYNNNKFVVLLVLFFFSMAILATSDSFLNLMLGWDGLGLSSLCLIMFYPNKNTLFNSLLTMFFNRLGDIILIVVFSSCFLFYSIFFLLGGLTSWAMLILILVCSFTKSAQFPLSSWLPAAMSAPTPISAMVHSSTLVTAGVYMCSLAYWSFNFTGLNLILLFFSASSFMVGGLMANFELDLKKTIAFSTMSQISMIMFFVASASISLALSHMVFHAFFKTTLFCCAGGVFIYFFSDQISSAGKSGLFSYYSSSLFYLSIFSMTGLMFSSSFFSKDLILEFWSSKSDFVLFWILVTSSLFTLSYCAKLSSTYVSFVASGKTINSKSFFFKFSAFFGVLTLVMAPLLKDFFFMNLCSFLSKEEVLLLSFLFLSSLMLNFSQMKFNLSLMYTLTISFMKLYTYSFWGRLFENPLFAFSFSDSFIFKPYVFYPSSGTNTRLNLQYLGYKSVYLVFMIIVMWMCY